MLAILTRVIHPTLAILPTMTIKFHKVLQSIVIKMMISMHQCTKLMITEVITTLAIQHILTTMLATRLKATTTTMVATQAIVAIPLTMTIKSHKEPLSIQMEMMPMSRQIINTQITLDIHIIVPSLRTALFTMVTLPIQ